MSSGIHIQLPACVVQAFKPHSMIWPGAPFVKCYHKLQACTWMKKTQALRSFGIPILKMSTRTQMIISSITAEIECLLFFSKNIIVTLQCINAMTTNMLGSLKYWKCACTQSIMCITISYTELVLHEHYICNLRMIMKMMVSRGRHFIHCVSVRSRWVLLGHCPHRKPWNSKRIHIYIN